MIESATRQPVRVMVVNDSPDIVSIVRRGLQRRGYEVIARTDGETALATYLAEPPDLVVLDLMLPDIDGLEVCRRMLEAADVPIVMLTSRDTVPDRVDGLRAGGDDYVVKPFAMEELAARIEAVLRRRRPERPHQIVYEDLVIDVDSHRVTRAGHDLPLTPKEFAFLETLARRPDRVIPREVLMGTLWPHGEPDDNLLDAHTANLRQKLEAHGGRRLIQTVRGIGLVLR